LALSLAIHGLDAGYGAVKALRGVSLHVEAGETVALLGTNGNGKSTLMKCVAGLVRPTRGSLSLTIDGTAHDLTKLSAEAIVDLGVAMVPEGRRLFPRLTVKENLMLGAFRKQARQNIDRNLALAFETFPALKGLQGQLAGTMSGGQQQMLAIARALACQPELLMLDEPTEGLAPSVVNAIRAGILESRARGVSILLVEQNLRLALSVGDVFFVLSRGTVVFRGTRAELEATAEVIREHLGVGRLGQGFTSG
jgi:branched-chain amino acid transport system ATP-binding protein